MRRTLNWLLPALVAVTACRSERMPGEETATPAPPSAEAPAEERTTPLKALAETQSLEIRTALSTMNRALLEFYVANDRYPRDLAEVEGDGTTAGAFATVREAADSVAYLQRPDGGYRMVVHVPNGAPLTMEAPPPTAGPPAP